MPDQPLALIAELTHRCPLRCVYCSNPLELAARKEELTTAEWINVFEQAAAMGMFHVHLTGGEPLLRSDLEELVAAAHESGLYVNLITSGIGLNLQRLSALVNAGLDHIQLSLQDSREDSANEIAGVRAHAKKIEVARLIRGTELAFTVNLVVHRKNLDRLEELIEFAEGLGPQRIEIANVQYYGWALRNREWLLPSREQVQRSLEILQRVTSGAKAQHLDVQIGTAEAAPCQSKCSSGAKAHDDNPANAGLKACATRNHGLELGGAEERTSGAKAPHLNVRIGAAEAAPCQTSTPDMPRHSDTAEALPSQSKITSGAKAPNNDGLNAGLKACATQRHDSEKLESDEERTSRLAGRTRRTPTKIDFVTPDYYGKFPKPCMGAWGRRLMLIDPAGRAMPCHAASVIPNIHFDRVQERLLRWIWEESAAFNMFRGEDWMQEPCKTCPKRVEDFGGCRCQALLVAGNAKAADPVCSLSPQRALIDEILGNVNSPKHDQAEQILYRVNPAA